MIMERQGPGPSLAVATAILHRRGFYTTNITPNELSQLDTSDKSSLKMLVTVVSAVAMALITSTVVLRLMVRRHSVGRFFLDDYLVILASIFTLVVCSVVIAATNYGLGQHVWNINLADILDELKVCIQLMFVANIFYASAIAFTKLSIIASYMHIFAPRGLLKAALYATAFVTIGLGVGSILATIFECIPVAGAWTLTDSNAKCYTFVNFLYASTAINVTTDLILCIVPIPLFWRLQLPQRQKIMISVLFFLGGFACIASIIRLAYLHLLSNPIDVTYDLVSSVMWTIAECTIGIVCVSLPPLRSLFAKILPGVFGAGNISGSAGAASSSRQKSPMSPLSAHRYPRQGTIGTMGTIGSRLRKDRQGQPPQLSQKSVDIVVLSSLTSRHSRHSLRADGEDDRGGGGRYDNVVDLDHNNNDDDDDSSSIGRLARNLGMHHRHNSNLLGTGVTVTITAGEPLPQPLPQPLLEADEEEEEDMGQESSKTLVGSMVGHRHSHLAQPTNSSEVALTHEPSVVEQSLQRRPGGPPGDHDMEMGLIRTQPSATSLPDSEARLESGWDGRHAS